MGCTSAKGDNSKNKPSKTDPKKEDEADNKGDPNSQVKVPPSEPPKIPPLDPTNLFTNLSVKKTSINSEYKQGEKLGEGAFGSVYVVKHITTGIIRAMKQIRKAAIIKEEEENMFTEVNILKQMDHPNIIKLHELYQDDTSYYLITEYCNGGELFDRIKSMESFSEKEAADHMKQILSAVVYCHQQRIVHRDLKPENLLFDSKRPNANLKVIDFGTSRKFDPTKKLKKRLGTPYYIAPEVLNRLYDEKCDVWSCGVILYILLCGYPPFNGVEEDEVLKAVSEAKLTFDETDWKSISNDAKSLITKMLQKDPKQRITAKEAFDDPWIQKNSTKEKLSGKVLSQLGQFQSKNKLKLAILSFIATHVVSQTEKDDLLKTFKTLDNDGDGQLSKEELIVGYLNVYQDRAKAEEFVDQLFTQVDTNNSGKVDFSEFVVAAMAKEKLLSKGRIEQAFKMFDQDGNGQIERDELQTIMGGSEIDDQTWKNMLEQCDQNRDGKISQAEFIDLLLRKIQDGGKLF